MRTRRRELRFGFVVNKALYSNTKLPLRQTTKTVCEQLKTAGHCPADPRYRFEDVADCGSGEALRRQPTEYGMLSKPREQKLAIAMSWLAFELRRSTWFE